MGGCPGSAPDRTASPLNPPASLTCAAVWQTDLSRTPPRPTSWGQTMKGFQGRGGGTEQRENRWEGESLGQHGHGDGGDREGGRLCQKQSYDSRLSLSPTRCSLENDLEYKMQNKTNKRTGKTLFRFVFLEFGHFLPPTLHSPIDCFRKRPRTELQV